MKKRIWIKRKDRVNQRYWIGRKLKRNYSSSTISKLLDEERRKEIDLAKKEKRARFLKTPMTAKELNEEIIKFHVKDLPIRVFPDTSSAKIEEFAEQEWRDTINKIVLQRRAAKKHFKEHGKSPYKNFGSIRGLTIPELSSKAIKITDEGLSRLEHSPPVFLMEDSKGIEKKKYMIPGHALTILKFRSDKEKVLTSRLGDKFITISKNPHTMVGFESDTEEEAEKVHRQLEEEAEERLK